MRQRSLLVLMSLVLVAGPVAAREDAPAPATTPNPVAEAAPTPADPAPGTGDTTPDAPTVALGDAAALKTKLEASAGDAMMGTAMESHAKELLALLQQWGDAPFAEVLATCSPEGITSTQGLLEYAGASRSKYRETFAVRP